MKITEKQFAIASVASTVTLLAIWVVPHTIALRHLSLLAGCFSAIGLIWYSWEKLRTLRASHLPLFSILGLFIWVLIHYLFFSLNPALELSELKGFWIRSLMGAITAVGLGVAIVKHSRLHLYFYIALFSTPFINVASYCWASYLNNHLVKPNAFVFFLFTKIETVYFGGIAAAAATANIFSLMLDKVDKSQVMQILLWLLGLALVLVSALVSSAKNGIAISLGLCALLAVLVIINSILRKGISRVFSAAVLLTIVLLSAVIWKGHSSLSSRGWDTVFQDAAVGIDIDGNKQWQKREGSVPAPFNSQGVPAALNTYTRFAYAAVGIRLISQYPFGYGSINESFKGLQETALIPHEHQGQVHSGWIDFGLAFGVPGLLFVFTALLSIIYFGVKSKSTIAIPWIIISLTFIPLGLIAEISYKQYFEATIFFLTVGSTVMILIGKNSKEFF